jgi:hypothetical protein
MISTVHHRAVRTDAALGDLTERLIGEYSDRLPPGAVIACVTRTVRVVLADGVAPDHLVDLVDRFARQQLDLRTPQDQR